MSRGVVIFAHNNKNIDYVKMSAYSASRVNKHLGLPVTLITDDKSEYSQYQNNFDKIIAIKSEESNQKKRFNDGMQSFVDSWNNKTRNSVYDLTPYDETLVIDSDFIINTDRLKNFWGTSLDFLIYDKSFDLADWRDNLEFRYINNYSIKFYWATVFFFRKTDKTKMLFSLIEHIKENWNYYVRLYQLSNNKFRNDFAFSMAIHMMNGFTDGDFVGTFPNNICYCLDKDVLINHKDNKMIFLFKKRENISEYVPLMISDLDVHVMNKNSLMRVIDNV